MRLRHLAPILLCASGWLPIAPAHADILRCRDVDGKTLYTSAACPTGMRTLGTLATPQACTTAECTQRREQDLAEASERARLDKEELAALSADRRNREIADQRIDEIRHEAALRNQTAVAPSAEEITYPVYAVGGYPARCGQHCLGKTGHRQWPVTGQRRGRYDDRRIKPVGGAPPREISGGKQRAPALGGATTRRLAVDR